MFNQWESMKPMPEAVLHPAVAATNQRIYLFGGEDALQNPVRLIQVSLNVTSCCLHLQLFRLLFIHPPINHFFLSMCFCSPSSLLQVYHIARNMWCQMENRTVKNVSAPAAVMDDKIYIVGGSGNDWSHDAGII